MNASAVSIGEFIEFIAAEVSDGVEVAVESWMAQVDQALHDPKLTTLGRINSAKEVLARYKSLNGKTMLTRRGRVA